MAAAGMSLVVMTAGTTGLVFTGAASSKAPPRAHRQAALGNGGFNAGRFNGGPVEALPHSFSTEFTPAAAPPAPAPPSVADSAPLSPHQVFGFAPYWTLPQSSGFDVQGLTTIAYFSVDVNPDGSLNQSGAGWAGYESQDLANLVTRAHAAGDRVVLAVDCFAQPALDALTSSPTAPATLSKALIAAIEAKNLDGVNLDFEGNGSADQNGLTNLVAKVSIALHAVDPHWQVSMDTYASSAGDPAGFYDIKALAPWVDAFFVMAYQPNLHASPTPQSPLTSSMFSNLQAAEQYALAVDPAKVILGLPFYGYDWPTDNGTLEATATDAPSPVSVGQIEASGYPVYWDPVTETPWARYQVGNQWHEIYFEDPASLYLAAQLAQFFDLGGVGIWALGMEGSDPDMLAALDGFTGVVKVPPVGPVTPTTTTTTPTSTTTTKPVRPTAPGGAGGSGSGGSGPGPSSTTTTTGSTTSTTSTTTTSSSTTTTTGPSYTYTADWQGSTVSLTPESSVPSGTGTQVGSITDFQTTDPTMACLSAQQGLSVYQYDSDPGVYVVVTAEPSDCATAQLTFPVPEDQQGNSSGGAGSG